MFDMQSFLSGLALGLAGKPLALAREPVAYLYNGVRLPKLPEWDRVAYPYAVMERYWDGMVLYALSKPLYSFGGPLEDCSVLDWWCGFADAEWRAEGESTMTGGTAYFIPYWANFDVLNEDGTTYLAASDSVPVYE